MDNFLISEGSSSSSERSVWNFTLRDSPYDLINATFWGSPEYIQNVSDKFHIGDVGKYSKHDSLMECLFCFKPVLYGLLKVVCTAMPLSCLIREITGNSFCMGILYPKVKFPISLSSSLLCSEMYRI